MRARESRRKVRFKARMRFDRGWSDVMIRDMSSRGMLLSMDEPPKVGAYVEICGPNTTLVARAVWVKGDHFGVRMQDAIDVDSLVTTGRLRPKDPPPVVLPTPARPAEAHARSRQHAATMQFGTLLAGILIGAAMLALLLYTVLAVPMQAIADSLGG